MFMHAQDRAIAASKSPIVFSAAGHARLGAALAGRCQAGNCILTDICRFYTAQIGQRELFFGHRQPEGGKQCKQWNPQFALQPRPEAFLGAAEGKEDSFAPAATLAKVLPHRRQDGTSRQEVVARPQPAAPPAPEAYIFRPARIWDRSVRRARLI